MVKTNEVGSTGAGGVTVPLAIAEDVTYNVPRVNIQFAINMHVVSVSVKVEYRIATVTMRDLTCTVSGPLSVSYVNSFATSVSLEDTVKPLGGSGSENSTMSTD